MRQFYILTLLFSIFLIYGSASFAQSSLPEISLVPNQMNGIRLHQQDSEDSTLVVNNPLMRDIIILQNQINLLNGLLERQSEVEDIAFNYERIGVPFKQPAPPQSTCEKLPLNILCLFFYPNLKVNQSIVAESVLRFEERQQRAIDEAIARYKSHAIQTIRRQGNLNNNDFVRPQENRYYWSDIQCKRGECTALIENNFDVHDRIRLGVGQSHDNGLKITQIDHVSGLVQAIYNGSTVEIEALDIAGKSVNQRSPEENKSEIMDILQESLNGQDINTVFPDVGGLNSAEAPELPIAPQVVQDSDAEPLAPMLGATGLF